MEGVERTDNISFTRKKPPPPLRPRSATIAPGKKLIPPTPLIPPRNLVSGAKRIGTRTPDPIIRDDSRTKDDSLSFAPDDDTSASWTILPTMVLVSWHECELHT